MKKRNSDGFTLAEMLIVVGIIVVLMGVSFVGVQNYQSSSTRLELDTIAKEIFIAAQNHLTEAESQGLVSKLDAGSLGYPGTLDEDKIDLNEEDEIEGKQEVYYVLNDGKYNEALDLLLPDYAIDSTVRSGSYVIRYQPSTGTVLDVFYSRPGNSTFLTRAGTTFTYGKYEELMGLSPNYRDGGERNREKYDGNKIIGWYGGEDPIPTGERLRAPTFEIHNEETLWVRVTDPNTNPPDGYRIKLIVIGKSSGAEKYFGLINETTPDNRVTGSSGSYHILLDDITQAGMHFADLEADKKGTKGDGGFIPGEDLEIKAVAYSASTLANVAMSAAKTTNSLFADPYPYDENKPVRGSDVDYKDGDNPAGVAGIANFRHLENLDAAISELGRNDDDSFGIARAGQTADLSWTGFLGNTVGNAVYMGNTSSANGCFLPMTPQYSGKVAYPLIYDGQNHKVSDVKVEYDGAAGLFGTLTTGSMVKDLELIDFEIKSTSANAGALVGTATGTTITNILAHNSIDEAANIEKLSKNIEASGSAGGLIGSASDCHVSGNAAALYVKSTGGNAGGLIGTSTGGTVTASYSSGHTKDGSYDKWVSVEGHSYDVTGATAGGLVGRATATITNSYSTCSVSGSSKAGGFVGSAGGSIENCYAVGLIDQTKTTATVFAFAGSSDKDLDLSGNYYYLAVNEIPNDDDGTEPMLPVSGYEMTRDITKVKPLDLNTDSYNGFVGPWDDEKGNSWNPARAYDPALVQYYSGRYTLRTVDELNTTVPDGYTDWNQLFVAIHYGDWPSPEVFFINNS